MYPRPSGSGGDRKVRKESVEMVASPSNVSRASAGSVTTIRAGLLAILRVARAGGNSGVDGSFTVGGVDGSLPSGVEGSFAPALGGGSLFLDGAPSRRATSVGRLRPPSSTPAIGAMAGAVSPPPIVPIT